MRAPLQKPVFLHIQIYLVIAVLRLPAAGKDRGEAEVTPFLRLYVGISCACISKSKIEPVLLIQLIFYRHFCFRCHIINGEFDAVVIFLDSEFYSIIVKEFGIIQINIQHLTGSVLINPELMDIKTGEARNGIRVNCPYPRH